MLARKLTCYSCGANKINEVATGYIYCDYCGEFIGYDFEKIQSESTSIFDYEYFQKYQQWPPETQEYLSIIQNIGTAMKEKDGAKYVEYAHKLQELEIKLFPNRFSPKMKLEQYRKQFLNYYKHFLEDKVADNFFEEQIVLQQQMAEMQAGLTTEYVDYKPVWKYDEKLEKYFDEIKDFCRKSTEKTMNYPSIEYFPEPVNEAYSELLYKQTINAYTQNLDKEAFEKIVEYLGLKTQYIEVPEVKIEKKECSFCGAPMNIPEGSTKSVCEQCGNAVYIQSGEIDCVNCGAKFVPEYEKNKCPYCDSQIGVLN